MKLIISAIDDNEPNDFVYVKTGITSYWRTSSLSGPRYANSQQLDRIHKHQHVWA